MVSVALPIWLMIVMGLGLLVLTGGAIYGLMGFMRQVVGGEVDFEGAIPDLEVEPADTPWRNPRLRGVDDRLAGELMRRAEDELRPR